MVPQRAPLFGESELQGAAPDEFLGHLPSHTIKCGRVAKREVARPLVPISQLMMRAQCVEEHEILEPILVLATKAFEAGATFTLHIFCEAPRRFGQQWHFAEEDFFVLDRTVGFGQIRDATLVNPAVLGQTLKADQQRIAGECRGRRIWRVAVAQGAEWQHLPQSLPGCGEKVDKLVRRRTEVADPPARGKRTGMQQNSCGAREWHGSSEVSVL